MCNHPSHGPFARLARAVDVQHSWRLRARPDRPRSRPPNRKRAIFQTIKATDGHRGSYTHLGSRGSRHEPPTIEYRYMA
ncbi:hypothetical protein EVAR_40848_1 [Eumeta japonica]|uniref:Uncharacterized protein n=1 Tax=Eumeta variegata TaxID=151549 RepID=A0A4C1ZV42_EUMVA|nr:hypothetical protein EVAR_40848_1 [Eumeta japonica]